MTSPKGIFFAVLYTSNGLLETGEPLGYEIVVMDHDCEERPRIIAHRNRIQRMGEKSVMDFMDASLVWAAEKYPDYAAGTTRVKKGPMPPHPDSISSLSQQLAELDKAIDEAKARLGDQDRFVMGMMLARLFLKSTKEPEKR